MHIKHSLAALLIACATLVQAQTEPLIQRDLSNRTGRFLDLSPSQAEPLYVVNTGQGAIQFDATGVRIEQASSQSSKLKSLGVHPGMSYAFEGGTRTAPIGQKPGDVTYSSYVGPQNDWQLNRSSYGELAYRNVWPGVDAVFKSTSDALKYQFEVAAGANPRAVVLRVSGAQSVRLTKDGALEWKINGQTFRDGAPIAWQTDGKRRNKVTADYVVQRADDSTWLIGFALGDYNTALPLVIDPAWPAAAGLVGSNANDIVNAVVRDAVNKATWVCGSTQVNSNHQAFVARFADQAVNTVPATTGAGSVVNVYGGNGYDSCHGLVLDAQGDAYMAGVTDSSDFVMAGTRTDSRLRDSKRNSSATPQDKDAFFAKISRTNGSIVWSSLFGSAGDDQANALAIDGTGRLYITGFTEPECDATGCIPAVIGNSTTPFADTITGKKAFVARVAADGKSFEYYSAINSDGDVNIGHAIAVDPATNAVLVAGETNTTKDGMPTTSVVPPGSAIPGYRLTPNDRPVDSQANGDVADGFVARINPTGSGYEYFTLLTGSANTNAVTSDRAFGLKLLSDRTALVVGETSSTGFASASNSLAGNMDGFVLRLSADGTSVQSSRYIGGSGYDSARDVVAVPIAGTYYVLGNTSKTLTNIQAAGDAGGLLTTNLGDQDAFLAQFNISDNTPNFWGLFGSTVQDGYNAMAVDVVDIDAAIRPQGRTVLYAGGASGSADTSSQRGELRRIDSYGPPAALDVPDQASLAQSAIIFEAYNDLKVQVKDRLNAPVPRVIVTFSAPNTADSPSINKPGISQITADVDGYATLDGISANGFAGAAYAVTATAGTATTSFTLTNLKANQTGFAVSASPNPLAYQAVSTLTPAGGQVGLDNITYTLDTGSDYCSLALNKITALKAGGSCTVTANNPGNGNYHPTTASVVINTIKAAQPAFTVTAGVTSMAVGDSTTYSVSDELAGSGSTTTVTASPSTVCTIVDDKVHAQGAGNCTLNAHQSGDANYFEAFASTSLAVTKGSLGVLAVTATPNPVNFGSMATIDTQPTVSSGAITQSVTSGPCTIAGNTLTPTGVGTCVITATQAEDANYLTTQGSVSVTIQKGTQASLGIAPPTASVQVGGSFTLTASGGTTGTAVTYTLVGSTANCTLTSTTIQATAPGTCTVTATMPGGTNYNDVTSAPITITFANLPQSTVTLTADKSQFAPGGTATLTASGGNGSGSYSYHVVSGACTVNSASGVVAASIETTCVVNAKKAASSGWDEATSANLAINVLNQAQAPITLTADKLQFAPGGSATVTATGGSGVINYTYHLVSGACTVGATTGVVTASVETTCVVNASNPASTGYTTATSANLSISVVNEAQAPITITAARNNIQMNETTTVTAAGGSGVIQYTYQLVSGAAACTLNSATGEVKGIGIGDCEISASNGASLGFNAATSAKNVIISVGKATQTLTFNLPTGPIMLVAVDVPLSATTNAVGLLITQFTSKTPEVCEVQTSTLKFLTAGTCTVTASQEGDATYAAAELDASVNVVLPAGVTKTLNGKTPSGADIQAQLDAGGDWVFEPIGTGTYDSAGFIALDGHPRSPADAPPSELTFPYGLFSLVAINGRKGTSASITITYPDDLPANAQYWKYGPTADNATPHWYEFKGAVISGKTVTLTLTDGGAGDSDLTANSIVRDPGNIAISKVAPPVVITQPVPGLGEWMRVVLAALVLLAAAMVWRRPHLGLRS